MKKIAYAFLIGVIVVTAIVLLLVKYPKPNSAIKTPADMIPAMWQTNNSSGVPVMIPSKKLPAGTMPPPTAESLYGTTWIWEKTVMQDGTIITPKKAGAFAIAFGASGRLSGKTGCNGFFGTYTIGSDGVITFGPISSTLMYCEESQEGEFTKPFADVTRYSFDANGNLILSLKDDAGVMVLMKK